ncbi:hypothetical protein AC1031_008725 [Aphanomyces cochlioides]|nr:hypothetical protein AC1031_008725 [Aphanomyces cochlioides]
MKTIATVLALASSSAFGAECTTSDFSPFTSQLLKCRTAANLPSSPTADDIINACKFAHCATWYQQISTLSCTSNGVPASYFSQICSSSPSVSTTPTTTIKPTTKAPTTSAPRTTAKPSSTTASGVECENADYAPITPLRRQCVADSGISNITTSNLPMFCATPSCVTYTLAYQDLTCTIDGRAASLIATLCDSVNNSTDGSSSGSGSPVKTTTAKPSTSTECTSKDTPAGFATLYQTCLYVAGLAKAPNTLSGLVALCQYEDCTKVFTMYAGLSCTVSGLPASAVATTCSGVTASPSLTTETPSAPTTTLATTTIKPPSDATSLVLSTVALVLSLAVLM